MPKPIHLRFSSPKGESLERGPFQSFCLQGETLREKVGGPTFAVHEDHSWHIDGKVLSRVDCDCRVKVTLSRVDGKLSKKYGPFDSFSCLDGIAYVDHSVFAFADRAIGDWYCHADGMHWAIVLVEATD